MRTASKLNCSQNIFFFFPNRQRCLSKPHNFSLNLLLTPRFRKYNYITHNIPVIREIRNDKSMGRVAKQIFSCQDTSLKLGSRDEGLMKISKIPFQIVPKEAQIKTSRQSLLRPFIKLTKPNLTVLVTLSSICSYAISPNSLSLSELAFLTLGTALCSGAANAINMGREPEFDRKMTRTAARPVVTGLITPKQAFQFACVSGSVGCTLLYFGVNPTVALLGFANIGLYGWIYTSLKRKSILNTWIGAVVGAIPPLMGWAASSSLLHPGSWCLAALLYAWQFPHFNALSHNIAEQYKQAGYVMTAAENPKLNARVALRYSLLMFPICFGLSYFEVTDWFFQFDSGIANAWMSFLAFQFWKQQRQNHATGNILTTASIQAANNYARKLFWCSVWQLPVVLVLAMLHKRGQWDRMWTYLGLSDGQDHTKASMNRIWNK